MAKTELKGECTESSVKTVQGKAGLAGRAGSPSPADEIPLSGRRELHLQDFTAPLFITWLCQVGHH